MSVGGGGRASNGPRLVTARRMPFINAAPIICPDESMQNSRLAAEIVHR